MQENRENGMKKMIVILFIILVFDEMYVNNWRNKKQITLRDEKENENKHYSKSIVKRWIIM